MIENLCGTKETVMNKDCSYFKIYINDLAENYPLHWHSEMEIIMPLENEYTIIINHQEFVLNPGDIAIISPGTTHELIAPESGRRLIFQVSHSMIKEVGCFDTIYSRFYPCAVFRSPDTDSMLRAMKVLLLEIIDEYSQKQPLWDSAVHSKAIQFFVLAGRYCLSQSDFAPSGQTRKRQTHIDTFFNICTYITDHCSENISLEDAARRTGFSKSQFIRLFKDYSGVSFYDYLTAKRLRLADIYLSEPEYSITEAAMRSGFNSLATFNRVFKAHHQCTPMEYRHFIWENRKQK